MADQIPDSAKSRAAFALAVSKIDRDVRLSDLTDAEIDALIASTRAAPPAMDREAVERVREAAYRQALEDVCNPLGYLQRMADAEGAKLSGMAYAIASDIGTIQRIAKEALSTLSADAIRQGEGEVFTGVEAWDELVNFDDRTSPEEYPDMCLITRDELIDFMERATPASHASDGGEA